MEPVSSDQVNRRRQQAFDLLARKQYRQSREMFERVYDGQEAAIASCLGFIHAQINSAEYDYEKAVAYYQVAANQGHPYSQYALGGLLMQRGQLDKALEWYIKASDLGNAECSYAAFQLLRRRGDLTEARRLLDRAVALGHPIAIQRRATEYLKGQFGVRHVPTGIWLYFKNIPNLIKYAKENV
jgi:TPR repeat protein